MTQTPKHQIPGGSVSYVAGRKSVWGTPNSGVVAAITSLGRCDRLLNLCCGDGRYHEHLSQIADSVCAIDSDPNAVSHLKTAISAEALAKTATIVHDIRVRLPFSDQTINCVFCSAALHLFNPRQLSFICAEIERVLVRDGIALVDFSHSIERVGPDGKLVEYSNEHKYSESEALDLIQSAWPRMTVELFERGLVPPHAVDLGPIRYVYSSSAFMIRARRRLCEDNCASNGE